MEGSSNTGAQGLALPHHVVPHRGVLHRGCDAGPCQVTFPHMLGQLPGLSSLLTGDFGEVWKTEKDPTFVSRRMDMTSL